MMSLALALIMLLLPDAYVTVQLRNTAPCALDVRLTHDRRQLYLFSVRAGGTETLQLRIPSVEPKRFGVEVKHAGTCPFPEYSVSRRETLGGLVKTLEIVVGQAPAHSIMRLR
jgi:hypothetical protein